MNANFKFRITFSTAEARTFFTIQLLITFYNMKQAKKFKFVKTLSKYFI